MRRRRPSPSMLVAIAAVVLASAGSATAARMITGKQIKNSSITYPVVDGEFADGEADMLQVECPDGSSGLLSFAKYPAPTFASV